MTSLLNQSLFSCEMRYFLFNICSIICVFSSVSEGSNHHSFGKTDASTNQQLPANSTNSSITCDTLIIFDLSRKVTSEDVFEISVKQFLNYIRLFCHKFKYTVMDESFGQKTKNTDETGTKIKECDDQKACEEHIILMDYNNMILLYTDEEYDSDSKLSKTYFNFLNATLSLMSSCKNYSVLLLTNRIVHMDIDEDFMQICKTMNWKTILLGRNDSFTKTGVIQDGGNANFPNIKTLNFANFDCLNYLLYCILPCSNDTVECFASDIDDCRHFSALTPNDNPDQTLHLWIVEAMTGTPDTDDTYEISKNIFQGMQNYVNMFDIPSLRFQYIADDAQYSGKACEHVTDDYCWGSTGNIPVYEPPIGDDRGVTNERLAQIPWSKSLTKIRTGILSVIIYTDFATPSLLTFNNIEKLTAQVLVYNSEAFKYYTEKYMNETNLHFSLLNLSDPITIIPINNGGFLPSPLTISTSTTYGKITTETSTSVTDFKTLETTKTVTKSNVSKISSTKASQKSSVNQNSFRTSHLKKYCFLIFAFVHYIFS